MHIGLWQARTHKKFGLLTSVNLAVISNLVWHHFSRLVVFGKLAVNAKVMLVKDPNFICSLGYVRPICSRSFGS